MRYNQKILSGTNPYTFSNRIYDNASLARYINARLFCLKDRSDSISDEDLLFAMKYEMNIAKKIRNMQPLDRFETSYLEYMLDECEKEPMLLYSFPMLTTLLNSSYNIGDYYRNRLNVVNDEFSGIMSDVTREVNAFNRYIKSREYLSKKADDPTKYRKFPLLTKYYALYVDHFRVNKNNDDNFPETAKKYFSYLVNSRLCTGNTRVVNSSYEMMFISKYLYFARMHEVEKSFNIGFKGKVKMEHDDLAFLYCSNSDPNTLGYFSENKKSLYINSKDKDIISVMFSVIHEISHYGQYLKATNGIMSDEAFEYTLFMILGNKSGRDYKTDYARNYRNQEIEHEANIRAYNYLIDFLSGTCDNEAISQIQKIILNYIDKKYQSSVTVRKNGDNGLTIDASIYKFELLDSEVKSRPYLITSYPILQYFYNSNGNRKDYITILKETANKRELSNALFQCFSNLTLKKQIDSDKIFKVDYDELPQLSKGLEVMFNEISRFFDNISRNKKMYHNLNANDRLKINSIKNVYEECQYLYHFISQCRNDLVSQSTLNLINQIGVKISRFTF